MLAVHRRGWLLCTITSSKLKAIDVGSKVIYAQAATATGLDSDLVLHTGPGNSAFGHVTLSSLPAVVTFSGGTAQFRGFEASVIVAYNPITNFWYWDGAYSFDPPGTEDFGLCSQHFDCKQTAESGASWSGFPALDV